MTEPLPIVPACPDCTGVKWLYLGKLKNRYRCIGCGREMTYAQLSELMRTPAPGEPGGPNIIEHGEPGGTE